MEDDHMMQQPSTNTEPVNHPPSRAESVILSLEKPNCSTTTEEESQQPQSHSSPSICVNILPLKIILIPYPIQQYQPTNNQIPTPQEFLTIPNQTILSSEGNPLILHYLPEEPSLRPRLESYAHHLIPTLTYLVITHLPDNPKKGHMRQPICTLSRPPKELHLQGKLRN